MHGDNTSNQISSPVSFNSVIRYPYALTQFIANMTLTLVLYNIRSIVGADTAVIVWHTRRCVQHCSEVKAVVAKLELSELLPIVAETCDVYANCTVYSTQHDHVLSKCVSLSTLDRSAERRLKRLITSWSSSQWSHLLY